MLKGDGVAERDESLRGAVAAVVAAESDVLVGAVAAEGATEEGGGALQDEEGPLQDEMGTLEDEEGTLEDETGGPLALTGACPVGATVAAVCPDPDD